MQQVILNVSDEFKSAGDAIGILIADIKSGKSVAQMVSDTLPGLIAAIGGYANMGADIKMVDNQVYLLRAVAQALEPVAAPAVVAPASV